MQCGPAEFVAICSSQRFATLSGIDRFASQKLWPTIHTPRTDLSQRSRKGARLSMLPRFVRHRDAPTYLGMDRNRFNTEVRPHLTTIPIGTQGVAFDRLELDAWADEYKSRNGRPGRVVGGTTWDGKERQAFQTEWYLAHREASSWPTHSRELWHR
jgi:hypothetical protein